MLAIAIIAMPQLTSAAQSNDNATVEPESDYNAAMACSDIKAALRALGEAEHDEAFALDLASEGGGSGSMPMVEARLSKLLERSQDLRMTLRRARVSRSARDPMAEQCIKTGFRALATAEKLSSDVETVLFARESSTAAEAGPANDLIPGGIAPKPASPAPIPER
ncbi:MAG TPA: hypothetical protein VEU51_03240 [Candidatus Acidoferrales bacterium]|nr:hypothetical protein [Candidatus Acidoferrales bacterium]